MVTDRKKRRGEEKKKTYQRPIVNKIRIKIKNQIYASSGGGSSCGGGSVY